MERNHKEPKYSVTRMQSHIQDNVASPSMVGRVEDGSVGGEVQVPANLRLQSYRDSRCGRVCPYYFATGEQSKLCLKNRLVPGTLVQKAVSESGVAVSPYKQLAPLKSGDRSRHLTQHASASASGLDSRRNFVPSQGLS